MPTRKDKKKPRRIPGLLAGSSWLLHIKQMYIKIGMDETGENLAVRLVTTPSQIKAL